MKTIFYKGFVLAILFVAVGFIANAQEKAVDIDLSNQEVLKRTIDKPDRANLQQKRRTEIKNTQPVTFDKNAVIRKEVFPKK